MRRFMLLLCFVAIATANGCSRNYTPPAETSSSEAVGALTAVLDAWKGGQTPEALREQKPSIIVADDDWQAKCELQSYQLFDLPASGGVSARIGAILELSGPQGRVRKEVRYQVSTNPIVSVVREDE
ncbi:MAG: hypothetical protein RIS70_3906 [Planctomycetota bacterium]